MQQEGFLEICNIKDDTDALEKSLIENLQRDDLTDIERENAIWDLWTSKRYETKRDLAKQLGCNEQIVKRAISSKEFRESENVSHGISSRTITATAPLDKDVRKKLIEGVEKKRIKTSDLDEIVSKVKEFPEPEQQLEMLELYEQRQEEDGATFNEVVTKYKEIAKGERPPEDIVEKDPAELRFNTISKKCDELLWMTPSTFNIIKNREFRKKAIEKLKKTVDHGHKLLIALGETEVLDG